MDRELVKLHLERATNNNLIRPPHRRWYFTLRKDYIYIHMDVYCNPYWYGTEKCGRYNNSFSTMIKIPTKDYNYRKLANAIRKARKEFDEKQWINFHE